MAMFCDFENVALGVRDAKFEKFDIRKVLERLLLKGSIVVKKAYCDWDRYKAFKAAMHEAAFELIEIPHVRQSGKNSADIRLVVDALDLCYTKSHVDTFVIVSGDSDFSPLVSKLRENDKKVIGIGVKNSTSDLLIANCDEFIFYDDLVREQKRRTPAKRPSPRAAPKPAEPVAPPTEAVAQAPVAAEETKPRTARGAAAKKTTRAARPRRRSTTASADEPGPAEPADNVVPLHPEMAHDAGDDEASDSGDVMSTGDIAAEAGRAEAMDERRHRAIDLVLETVEALLAERGDNIVWGSMVKQTLKRRQPGFNESYYGFRSFNALLEEAQARGLIALNRDDKSGGFKVRVAERVD
ncbi:MAG: NYN domain-containing protein [Pseudomonadota bacterium]|nr:NYN domain-containing protein [Pseudomonadota bacterium]